jgi:hypothetical protein
VIQKTKQSTPALHNTRAKHKPTPLNEAALKTNSAPIIDLTTHNKRPLLLKRARHDDAARLTHAYGLKSEYKPGPTHRAPLLNGFVA